MSAPESDEPGKGVTSPKSHEPRRSVASPESDEPGRNTALLALPIAIGVIGLSVFLALPIFVGGLVEGRGFTEREAGLISSVEMAGLAIGNVAFLLLAHRVGVRALAIVSLTLFAVGNGGTALAQGFDAIVAVRCVSGIGGGASFALTAAVLSGTSNPDRAFSIFLVAQLMFQAIALWIGPSALQVTSVDVLYALPAIAAVVALPFLAGLERFERKAALTKGGASFGASLPLLGMTLAAMMLLFAATGGVWTFLERMGAAAGLEPGQIGLALGASGIAGVLGPSVTLWLSRQHRRIVPLVVFMALLVGAQLFLMLKVSFSLYLAVACAFNFAWNALIPYYYGVLAELDREGRAAVAGNVLATVGLSAGAAVAAGLAQGQGYGPLLSIASAACLASLALVLVPVVKRARGARGTADVAA